MSAFDAVNGSCTGIVMRHIAVFREPPMSALAAGITGLTFHDLRGTAVTRLALAECTEAEIAVVTGHTMADVRSILDRHYLNRDPKLAERTIRKLEARTKVPDRTPDWS